MAAKYSARADPEVFFGTAEAAPFIEALCNPYSSAMQIATDPHALPLAPEVLAKGCAVTIGNFDGVHYGHRQLINRTIEKARAAGLPAVVITFTPHPLRVVMGDKAPPMLMSLRQKLACLADLGVDLTLVIHFTQETAAITPEEFVEDVLVKGLNTKE